MKLSEKVVIVFIGKLVSGAFSFATGILLARMLTKVDFGTYQQAMLIVAYVTPLALFGIDQSVTFFIPRFSDGREIKTFIYQTTAILFLIGFLACIGLLLSASWLGRFFHNPDLKSVLVIFALYPIFNFPFSVASLVLYSLDKQKLSATIEVASASFQFLAIAILVLLGFGLNSLFMVLVVVALLKVLVSILIYRSCIQDRIGRLFDRDILRNQFRFSAPLGLSKILPVITVNLDKIIISAFFTVRDFAVYYVGAMELPFVSLITYTMGNVISPKLSQLYFEKRKDELISIWHRMVHKTSICLYPIFVFLIINAADFIKLLYGEKYEASIPVFQIYLFLFLVRVSDNAAVIRACNYPALIFKASVLVFVSNLILTISLLRIIGILGPAVATVLAIYINFFYIIQSLKSVFKLGLGRIFPWAYLVKVLGIAMICGVLVLPFSYLLPIGFLNLFIKGLVYVSFYTFLMTRFGLLEESDWDLVKKYTGIEFLKKMSKTVGAT